MDPQELPTDPHRFYEDLLAMLLGTLFVALGVHFYTSATLLTGSTAGMALLLQYGTGGSFGLLFFLINLPFYALAIRRMGWNFTLRTFVAIGLVSLFSELTGDWIAIDHLQPLYAALMGGSLIGLGMLVLFRHRTSLGGINILALFLQQRYGWRAGYVQLGIDGVILLVAFFMLPLDRVVLSVFGALALNMIIALNHKPGRYLGVS
ncbi:YitT family protein [Halomonas nitroreducens]|uniref:YitT family protein n=1 Tax=Halomonas nitroreducens TaxID=447425 RepID=A0A431V2K8_9GAMM|nr:YitT family protein [Halomonas nitroreducens]RTR03351.1 YitT family protein [Halomonas nitroreducens]